MFVRLVVVFLSSLWFVASSINAKTIKIAAIDWCPQICIDQKQKGYVVDLVNEIYRDSGYQLDIEYLPWSRAIKYVSSGKADALLSPAKAEAPDLLYPEQAVGAQTMCFYTRADSGWSYQGVDSLKNLQIGIAIDTSIEELNSYVAEHPGQFQFQPYHERFISQNAGKLDKGRIDTFLFTRNSTQYELQQLGIWHNYREAGCVTSAPIYMAFTPASCQSSIIEMMTVFDQRMLELTQSSFIEQIMTSYGLH